MTHYSSPITYPSLLIPVNRSSIFLCFLLALGFAACNPTRKLPPGETLYDGAKVKVDAPSRNERKDLSAELEKLVRPRPNKKFLGFRYKLFFYNLVDTVTGKGFRYWVRNRLGEPPVLASQLDLEKNREILQNRLENKGYFHAQVTADTQTKKKITTAYFDAATGPQYKIKDVYWPEDTSILARHIDSLKDKTLLKADAPYDLSVIKDERIRIDAGLKDKGFFFFSPDYLLMEVDSTAGEHQVNIYVTIKEGLPENARYPYYINDIWVYADYSLDKDSLLATVPDEYYEGYHIIQSEPLFKNKMFSRTLVFKPYDRYNRSDHNRSLSRLVNLGVYRFVKARFEEVDTAGHYLDPYYFLTPLPKKSWRAQLTGLTKSNNATGSEISIRWANRNFFKAAEQFTFTGYYGIEQQISGNYKVATNRFGAEATLLVPRIIGFWQFAKHSAYVPRTRMNLAYEYYNRTTEYSLQSFRANYGFQWKPRITTEHLLNVISANYVLPANIQPDFQKRLDTDMVLARTIEKQFILGPNYNYNFNQMAAPNDRLHNFFLNVNIDVPGNILGLVTGSTLHAERRGKVKILNADFAQYARFEVEGRHYWQFSERSKTTLLASRLLLGYGKPYGNSFELPFIKSFFIGGVNSLRGFHARSLGPGTYNVRNDKDGGIIPESPGDMKLEANTELRAKLVSVVHGALFVDAGNIWTEKEDPARPGSQFTGRFLNQLAVDGGVGIRLDISFLVLRLDLAIPLRKPYLPGGPDWVFDQIDLGNPEWRKENLILNLAIGYPF